MLGPNLCLTLVSIIFTPKRIIRTITNSGPRDSTSPLFKKLELLKLEDIFKFELLKYMYLHIGTIQILEFSMLETSVIEIP